MPIRAARILAGRSSATRLALQRTGQPNQTVNTSPLLRAQSFGLAAARAHLLPGAIGKPAGPRPRGPNCQEPREDRAPRLAFPSGRAAHPPNGRETGPLLQTFPTEVIACVLQPHAELERGLGLRQRALLPPFRGISKGLKVNRHSIRRGLVENKIECVTRVICLSMPTATSGQNWPAGRP